MFSPHLLLAQMQPRVNLRPRRGHGDSNGATKMLVRQSSPVADLDDLHQELGRCSNLAASVRDEFLTYLIEMARYRAREIEPSDRPAIANKANSYPALRSIGK